jgi:hypothetical protein
MERNQKLIDEDPEGYAENNVGNDTRKMRIVKWREKEGGKNLVRRLSFLNNGATEEETEN